jgi:hypothetical protein
MAEIYCGNNALHPDLLNGTKIMGTKYQCLKKGIGSGLNAPFDADYALPYQPIDDRKIYCGNQNLLPPGYDRMGNAPQCLQKGVGIGKVQRAQQDPNVIGVVNDGVISVNGNKNKKKKLLITIGIIIFLLMYITKPNFITKLDEKNNIIIDWSKFILYYILIVLLFTITFTIIFSI